jgi:RecA/RadA recombinase
MTTLSSDVSAALASLQTRWGAAAPRVVGSLATAPLPDPVDSPALPAEPTERVVRTGFPELDAILGRGGLPRSASVAVRGSGSSGRTTLALRLVAEAQADGAIVAWLDLARSLDPVEAVARGVRLEWLVVLTPDTLDEGLSIAGPLLAGRSVDMLVVDLPPRPALVDRPARVAERLHRLTALARRAETLVVVLEPSNLAGGLGTAVAESTGLRLELVRRSWIRLGRDVVGQTTEATVARTRFGPPGGRAELRILYAEGGGRDACLADDALLLDGDHPTVLPFVPPSRPYQRTHDDAIAPPLLATSPAPAGSLPPLRVVPDGAGRHRRSALDGRDRDRRRPGRAGARRAARDPARERPSARA